MADYTVIADVSNTLINLLDGEANDEKMAVGNVRVPIILGSPGEIENEATHLSIFLYRIEENDYLKNNEPRQVNLSAVQYPPLNVDLFYMLTAKSSESSGSPKETERSREEQKILGRAMQILYDNSIVRGNTLQGSLAGSDVELRIVLVAMSMEGITQIWSTFQNTQGKPYRPSVFYQVTPVPIDSTRQRDVEKVAQKDMRYYQITRSK